MYIAAGRGRQPLGTKLWCQQKPLVTSVICYKLKRKQQLWSLILYNFFMILYMYIAPEQGLTTPLGRNFNANRNILSLRSFVASLKKISLKSDFIFFPYFIHVYIRRSGADNHRGKNLVVNRNILSLRSFVQVSKESLWSLILYNFFHDLYMYIAPEQRQTTTGDKILMSTEIFCHFIHLLQV